MFDILTIAQAASVETTGNVAMGFMTVLGVVGAAVAGSGVTIKIMRKGNGKSSKLVSRALFDERTGNLEKKLGEQREDIKGVHTRLDRLTVAQNNATIQILSAIQKSGDRR